jgi:hypothetical protein
VAAVYAAKARRLSVDGEHGVIRWTSIGKPPLCISSSTLRLGILSLMLAELARFASMASESLITLYLYLDFFFLN